MGLVLKGPLLAAAHADPDGEEVHGQGQGDGQEGDDAAGFGAAGEFVEEDQAQQDHDQHTPLGKGMLSIDLEKHSI